MEKISVNDVTILKVPVLVLQYKIRLLAYDTKNGNLGWYMVR